MEVIFSGFLLAVASPLLFLVGLITKLCHPKYPIIYKQIRLGKGEVPFECYKFRTMIDSHDNGNSPQPEEKKEFTNVFERTKVSNCKKITPFGAFIRKYYIDELPQLINVIKGDMSLIGPRPNEKYQIDYIREHNHGFDRLLKIRYAAKPGLTGPWQIDPNKFDLSDGEIINKDIDYIQNATFKADLKLSLTTVFRVFGGFGQ